MGPMGPMGPMMGGWLAGPGWLPLAGATLFVLGLALAALAIWQAGTPHRRRPRSPEEVLRERYARGELTREQYRQALVDILKDRYVLGDMALEEYEARLRQILDDEPIARVEEWVLGAPSRAERIVGGSTRRTR